MARLWREAGVGVASATNFDGCGFGKYQYIPFGPTSLVPFNS
jgi:hypothetical protein